LIVIKIPKIDRKKSRLQNDMKIGWIFKGKGDKIDQNQVDLAETSSAEALFGASTTWTMVFVGKYGEIG
jgi:hypothetical protein